MYHTRFVLCENILLEMLSNPHEFVSELGTIYDLGSKSTEYVFGFKKLIGLQPIYFLDLLPATPRVVRTYQPRQ
jgi:hypothetical protein